jgi:hypothetical protein
VLAVGEGERPADRESSVLVADEERNLDGVHAIERAAGEGLGVMADAGGCVVWDHRAGDDPLLSVADLEALRAVSAAFH